MHSVRALLTALLLVSAAAAVEAKSYSADRFDVRVEMQPGGLLRVTETVVFRFESGTFREVSRDLPSRRLDRIEVVRAAMDGRELPWGNETGTVEVRERRRTRIVWRFAPASGSTHTFELTYLVHGAVRDEADGDLLVWRALPGEHKYRIAQSAIDVVVPEAPAVEPVLASRRVGHVALQREGTRIRVDADTIRSNGWVEVAVRMPRGSVIASAPGWQQRERRQRDEAPKWIAAAGVALATGLILLFAVRQGYDAPPKDTSVAATGASLPDTLAPAEAGALVANGTAQLEHAMATLIALAGRGEIAIEEEPKGAFGQRRFVLVRAASHRPVGAYEQAVLDVVFTARQEPVDRVPLDKARSRLTSKFTRFRRALYGELQAHGLIDEGRRAVRNQYARIGVGLILAACILPLPLALVIDRFGFWPMLVPLALALVALVASICHHAHTPLSNDGVRRARYWRGFRDHLKEVAADAAAPVADSPDRLLPYAVALGLADQWTKFMKAHRMAVPAWFRAADMADLQPAFAAFVAHGGATAGSGGGAGGGMGAAGGGASGAR